MGLSTIEEKVNEGHYFDKDCQQFYSDLNLIVANCKTYNGKHHPIYRESAKELKEAINEHRMKSTTEQHSSEGTYSNTRCDSDIFKTIN